MVADIRSSLGAVFRAHLCFWNRCERSRTLIWRAGIDGFVPGPVVTRISIFFVRANHVGVVQLADVSSCRVSVRGSSQVRTYYYCFDRSVFFLCVLERACRREYTVTCFFVKVDTV